MAARSRNAATPAQDEAPEQVSVQWLDTWRKGNAKVTLFTFLDDNKLCVKVTTPEEEAYLNAGDIATRINEDEAVVRGWMNDALRFGNSVQAALDSYFVEGGWRSSKQQQEAKAQLLESFGV